MAYSVLFRNRVAGYVGFSTLLTLSSPTRTTLETTIYCGPYPMEAPSLRICQVVKAEGKPTQT